MAIGVSGCPLDVVPPSVVLRPGDGRFQLENMREL